MFPELRSERAFVEVVNKIRNSIFESKLLPGDHLPPERELSEVFGVSRMALREALRVIELSGLIEIKLGSKGGIFVADQADKLVTQSFLTMFKLNKFSLDDFFKARLVIEPEVSAEAARIRNKRYIDLLRENIKAFKNVPTHTSPRLTVSRDFHVLVARSSGNMFLEQILKSVIELSELLKIWEHKETSTLMDTIPEDHIKILHAIERGNPEEAKTAMSQHIQRSYDFFKNNTMDTLSCDQD